MTRTARGAPPRNTKKPLNPKQNVAEYDHDPSDDLDGSPPRRRDLAYRPLLAFLVVARATSGVADARADRGCAGRREGVGRKPLSASDPLLLGLALHPGAAGGLKVHSLPLGVP